MRIFVSSTWHDLQPERARVEAVVHAMRETKFLGMEYFGSRDESPHRASLEEVDRSELVVCILGGRWGSGITEAEYRRARDREIPVLVYVKDEAAIGPHERDDDAAGAARLAALKTEVAGQQLVRAGFAHPDGLAASVALDLHRHLFDRVLEPRLRRAAGTPKDGAAAQLLARIPDTSVLSASTLLELEAAGLLPGLERPQALARKAFLAGDAIDFAPLVADETRWYVGRLELIERIRAQVARQDVGGYVVVVADAGLGKTALAAELATRLRAPAFFCSVAGGLTTAQQCLRHLCAELILRHDLEHDHLPDAAGRDGAFLARLMEEAQRRSGEPVVLVVDALDEAEDAGGATNPLRLPDRLPPGCHVVATQRPMAARLAVQGTTRITELPIGADDPAQAADIEAHLRRQWDRPEVCGPLRRADAALDGDTFVRLLRDAAQGNFKYLDYVLADIRDGVPGFHPLDSARLPAGLARYYEQFWQRMGMDRMAERSWDDWDRLHRPVLTLLAVAMEPVTVGWFTAHTGRRADEIRARVLVPWQRFVSRRGAPGPQETWQVVHKSFADFLARRPELDLAAGHALVAGHDVSTPARWLDDDRYAARHVTAHLRRAGQLQPLLALVGRRDWYDAQMAAEPGGTLFVADVERAWSLAAEVATGPAPTAARAAALAGTVRCALTLATVNSLSANLRPGLVAELVRDARWTPTAALDTLARNPDADARAEGLAAVAPLLREAPHVERAFGMARALGATGQAALVALAGRLVDLGAATRTFEIVDAMARTEARAAVLAFVAPRLDDAGRRAALHRLQEIFVENETRQMRTRILGEDWHVVALEGVIADLPASDVVETMAWLEEASGVERTRSQLRDALVLRGVRLKLPDARTRHGAVALRARLLALADAEAPLGDAEARADAAQAVAEATARSDDMAWDRKALAAIVRLARRGEPSAPACLDRVLALVLARPGVSDHLTLAVLAPWMDEARLERAVASVRAWSDAYDRQQALVALAVRLVDVAGPDEAHALVGTLGDSHATTEGRLALLPVLARRGESAQVLELVGRVRDESRGQAVAAAAPFADAALAETLLRGVGELPERADWNRAAGAVAERLAVLGAVDRALEIARTVGGHRAAADPVLGALARAAGLEDDGAAMLRLARRIGDPALHARFLQLAAPRVPTDLLKEACTELAVLHEASARIAQSGVELWSLEAGWALEALLPRLAREADAPAARALADSLREPLLRLGLQLAIAPAAKDACEARQLASIAALEALGRQEARRINDVLIEAAPTLALAAAHAAASLLARQQPLPWEPGAFDRDGHRRLAGALRLRFADLGLAQAMLEGSSDDALAEAPWDAATLSAVARQADASARSDVVNQLLGATRDAWSDDKVKLLRAVAPLLEADRIDEALALAGPNVDQPIANRRVRAEICRHLFSQAVHVEGAAAAWARAEAGIAADGADTALLAGALAALAPTATPELFDALFAAASALIPAHHDTEFALVAIASRALAQGRRADALLLAHVAASHADGVVLGIAAQLQRAELDEVLPLLRTHVFPGEESPLDAVLERYGQLGELELAMTMACTLDRRRAEAFAACVRSLPPTLPAPTLHAALQAALRAAATGHRDAALPEIAALAPLIARAAGVGALDAVADDVVSVLATWP